MNACVYYHVVDDESHLGWIFWFILVIFSVCKLLQTGNVAFFSFLIYKLT